ncbi:hypothetical protein NBRC116495_07260 [Aurantivibrio plasticivorans]
MGMKRFNVEKRAILFVALMGASMGSWSDWYMDVTYSLNQGGLEGDGDSFGVITQLEVDNSSSGYQITGGFSFNQYLDLEFGFVDFGKQSVSVNQSLDLVGIFNPFTPVLAGSEVTGPGSFVDPDLSTSPTGIFALSSPLSANPPLNPILGSNLKTEVIGIRLAAVGKVPITKWFEISLQAGALISEYKVTTNNYTYVLQEGPCCFFDEVLVKETETSHDPELFMGLGLTWNISRSISTKLFWEKYLDFGEGDYLEQDLDSYNLSLRYRF